MIGSRISCWRAAAVAVVFIPSILAQMPSHAVQLSPSLELFTGSIARDGDRVFVLGINTVSAAELQFARSLDGGRTWPGLLRSLGYNTLSASLAVYGDRVVVGWSRGARYLAVSPDAGANWSTPQALPTGDTAPLLAADGLDIHAICIGGANAQGAWAVHSADGGQSWSSPTDLAFGLPAGADANPMLVTDGSDLNVFWERTAPQLRVVHQRSSDRGATWLPAPQVIANSPLVAVVAGAGRLYVQAGSTLLRSTNKGLSWTPVPGHGLAFPVALAMDGSNMLAVESIWVGTWTRRVATSRDAGSTWTLWPAFTDAQPLLQAAVAGTAMFLRTSTGLLQSDDFGSSWRLVGPEASTALRSQRDAIDVLTSSASAGTWVYGVEGHTRLGAGSTGSGSAIPELAGHGLCGIGRSFELELSHALGGTLAACLLDLGAAINHPVGSSTLYVAPSALSLITVTSGPIGQPGVGSATFPLQVPSAPIFVGARLLSQCFVLDPGVPAGFCASAARESWIR